MLVSSTPISVLVKIPYEAFKHSDGNLHTALQEVLAPFDGQKFNRWELGSYRMYTKGPDGQGGWAPSGNEYMPIEPTDDMYPGAAYYEDMKELMEPTWAVLDERGQWHEATPHTRAVFLVNFEENFLRRTAPDTVVAVVLCWTQA